jgi:hypothetical protein
MSTDNERELRERLDGALGTITPSGPPVGAVLRQGRTIRTRRRAMVAAGLAAVVGLGVALPGLVAHVNSTPPLVRHSYRVTVNPVRDTPSKLVFSGTINSRIWRFELDWDKGQVMQQGPNESQNNLGDLPPSGQPAWFGEAGAGSGPDGQLQLFGRVSRDVTRLAFNEPDGRIINVTPVRWHGQSWAGVGIPARQRLRSVVAYTARGELGYAIPFTDNTINVWLKPGQPGLARQRARIATGVLGRKRWSLEGYAGPWGICFTSTAGNGGGCFQAYGTRLRPGHFLSWMSCGGFVGPGTNFWNGQAASDVSYLEFRLSGGGVQRVAPVELAGFHYFALILGGQHRLTGWTAYGTSGQVLGSGPGWRTC